MMKPVRPEDVSYLTELDDDFSSDLKAVDNSSDFESFILKWNYWLDEETRQLQGKDWVWMSPLIADSRRNDVEYTEKHNPAMALTMPERLFKVSMTSAQFKVPWGVAYIRMKEEGVIDW